MKFLIQKINNEVRHDFAFTLLESIRFDKWLHPVHSDIKVKFLNTVEITEPDDIYPPIEFKRYHKDYIPIGSVEFVTQHLQHFYGLSPKPRNVPEVLFPFAGREIFNGNHLVMENAAGDYFVKSNDTIKGFAEFIGFNCREMFPYTIPVGNYQYSQKIDVYSEWRTFIYEGKIVGLQNYSGEFSMFPDYSEIEKMVDVYEKSEEAPIAYTLDVCVNVHGTFVMECHDFFSCGLYGFNEHKFLPQMFARWFWLYVYFNVKPENIKYFKK